MCRFMQYIRYLFQGVYFTCFDGTLNFFKDFCRDQIIEFQRNNPNTFTKLNVAFYKKFAFY